MNIFSRFFKKKDTSFKPAKGILTEHFKRLAEAKEKERLETLEAQKIYLIEKELERVKSTEAAELRLYKKLKRKFDKPTTKL